MANDNIRVFRLGTAKLVDREIFFFVDFDGGKWGTLSFPAELGGQFIDSIIRAVLDPKPGFPEITVLEAQPMRDRTGRLILMLHTAQAHTIVCTLSREQSDGLQEQLANFEALPLTHPEGAH